MSSGQSPCVDSLQMLLDKGFSSLSANDIGGAVNAAQAVLLKSPDNPSAYHLLGSAAMRDLKFDLANSLLSKAKQLSPNNGTIICDYLWSLAEIGRYDAAIQHATSALENLNLVNRVAVLYSRASIFHLKQNRIVDALADYRECLKLNPNLQNAAQQLGVALLTFGECHRGFRYLTARKIAQRPELLNDWCCPVLRLEHKGTRVLVKRDMGLGDELTYLRYLPWLTQAGIEVDYWGGRKLTPILQRMGYLHRVWPDDAPPPDTQDYDLSFIVNDLPVAVERLAAPDIAPPLPLTARPDLLEKWRAWLGTCGSGPYIGINWRAGLSSIDTAILQGRLAKVVDTEPFADALRPINATFISLQRNVLADELQAFRQLLGAPLHDASALTDDLEDLLALMALLDENVGVSNTNMHLRASLGLGSRVLVQNPGVDWRWGYEGSTSQWFTESKVYRQSLDGGWDSALQMLQADLLKKYGEPEAALQSAGRATVQAKAQSQVVEADPIQPRRLIWLTAGIIKNEGGRRTSQLASARYRVLAPAEALEPLGWKSEIVNEEVSRVMGGWGSAVPQAGDLVIISKVFTEHAIMLAKDAKARGACVVADFCDNLLDHPKRGPLQKSLLQAADRVVASTEAMAHAIGKAGYHVDAVISDPVEMQRGDIRFTPSDTLQLLWFGHSVNIDTLRQFLPKLARYAEQQPLQLNVVTLSPNGKADLDKIVPEGLAVTYTPWSVDATCEAIAACDIVVIPVLASQFKAAKSPNRLLEPLWAGRMVVAGPLPAYQPFGDSAWVGENLIEGLQWALDNPQEVARRIEQGQADIAKFFTVQAINQQWDALLKSLKKKVSPKVLIVDKETANVASTNNDRQLISVAILSTQTPILPSIGIRLIEPLSLLQDKIKPQLAVKIENQRMVINDVALEESDIVIVQRDFPSVETLPLLKKLKALGKKLVYETDDAFHLIPQTHSKAFHRAKAPAIFEFAKVADVITVSTQTLSEEFESYGKVNLLPNRLSASLWNDALLSLAKQNRTKQTLERLRIGLVGGANHRDDFALIKAAVQDIALRYPQIIWVAYGESAVKLFESIPECAGFEAHQSNYNYPGHAGRLASLSLDMALVPLEDNPFNQCISNLKYLEYGFLGVPGIYSDVEAYRTSVSHEVNGLLVVADQQAWIEAMQTLIDQPSLRAKIAAQARNDVLQHWMLTPENNPWKRLLESL